MIPRRHRTIFILTLVLLGSGITGIDAHRDPCHRLHACPSDQGTYVSGDLGHCEQCPDMPYCEGGKPTPTAQQTPLPSQPPPPKSEEASCATLEVCFTPGEDCTDRIVKILGEAKSSILVQAYSFTSAPIAKALVDAKKRGVAVQAILDKSNRTDKYSAADFLANSGIPTLIDAQHAIAHNKIIVVDHHCGWRDHHRRLVQLHKGRPREERGECGDHPRQGGGSEVHGELAGACTPQRAVCRARRRAVSAAGGSGARAWPDISGDVYRRTGTGANRAGALGRLGPGRVCGVGGRRQARAYPQSACRCIGRDRMTLVWPYRP
jgi:PLD-like domain